MFAAVDIGGTKTLVAVFTADGDVVERVKFPTPKRYEDFMTELAKTVASLSTKKFSYGAIGMPGRVDRKRGRSIRGGPNLPWTNTPVCEDFENIFGCKFVVENDANLAGLSEAIALGDKYDRVMYITISTGIGGGYVVDGRLDPDTLDAEVGHMILEHHGTYKKWEDFASGKAIVAKYGKRASDIHDVATWKAIVKDFGDGMINVIATLTPEVIVIGGGVGTNFDAFGKLLNTRMKHYETPMMPIPPIISAKRPEEAVIYGCYELATQHHAKSKK